MKMLEESIRRVEIKGRRYYEVKRGDEVLGLFPSITTILGATSDKSGLDKWRKKIGNEEADRISKLSMNRGTVMHRLIELYKSLQGTKEERLEQLKSLAKQDEEINEFDTEYIHAGWEMFFKFYTNSSQFFDRVRKVMAAEKFLWSVKGGGYAGTTDNVSEMHDDSVLIIDYKNSRKPKTEAWIQDYFLQASAYYVAYWERTGIRAHGVEIWIANEIDFCPQIFTLTAEDIAFYFKQFQQRLIQYKELIKQENGE